MRLTRAEIILVTCVLLTLAAGAVTKHYRDRARLAALMNTAPPNKTAPSTPAAPRPEPREEP